jgi:hypothetical protein
VRCDIFILFDPVASLLLQRIEALELRLQHMHPLPTTAAAADTSSSASAQLLMSNWLEKTKGAVQIRWDKLRLCFCLLFSSHITCHTSHVTRLTSHVTRLTSHFTRHSLYVTRHTSHITRHSSLVAQQQFYGEVHPSSPMLLQ